MERERLILSINRFDHYFDSVNNKTAVYIAINTFMLGSIITGYFSIEEDIIKNGNIFSILSILTMVVGFGSILLNTYASIPYFSQNSDSLYYFGGIGSIPLNEFCERSQNFTDEQDIQDLRNQVHTLSEGLNKKFRKLKLSGRLIMLQFVLIVPLVIIISLNTL
ncbi:hypothetical protein LCGC14_1627540 [marine sediment metagenome]|uniref:Pycsar effector protein domain-containing protein n=1 Tax=marine sediment metagenome TaxID=412755 RepID=A0A0F9IQM8_9ZZZZ